MVRPGSGRFEVGFWVGFRVGLRARDFPTEGVLSRTPLIIRTVDQVYLYICFKKGRNPFQNLFFSNTYRQDTFRKILTCPICSSGEHTIVCVMATMPPLDL